MIEGTGSGTVARTGRKGVAELIVGVLTAVLVLLSDNVAGLGLGAEGAVIASVVVQVLLQGVRRLGRDQKQGIPQ